METPSMTRSIEIRAAFEAALEVADDPYDSVEVGWLMGSVLRTDFPIRAVRHFMWRNQVMSRRALEGRA